jgi:hypothetical protein
MVDSEYQRQVSSLIEYYDNTHYFVRCLRYCVIDFIQREGEGTTQTGGGRSRQKCETTQNAESTILFSGLRY